MSGEASASERRSEPVRSAPLDGIRALAVVAVLVYHAHYPWAVGGYLGVDVFFVLSGYLITGVLLSTHRSWWGYRRFLVRRAVRLMPALLVAVLGITLVALATGMRAPLARCGGGSVGYLMNLPFTDAWNCPAMWHITWSLASEQQFYLAWPLLLWLLAVGVRRLVLRLRPLARRVDVSRRSDAAVGPRALGVAATGAVGLYLASLVWQVVQRLPGGVSTARVAYAPDGRSLVLLLGCALALDRARRRTRLRPLASGSPMSSRADVAVGGGVIVLAVSVVTGDLGAGVGNLVPLVAVAVASAALVWGAAHAPPASWTARWLGARPAAWLGRISYSLYLWHEVAYRLAETVSPRGTVVAEVLRFTLAVGFAAASHRWVEQPAQRWWSDRSAPRPAEDRVPVATS